MVISNMIVLQEVTTDHEGNAQELLPDNASLTARALILKDNYVANRLDNYIKKTFNRKVIEVK